MCPIPTYSSLVGTQDSTTTPLNPLPCLKIMCLVLPLRPYYLLYSNTSPKSKLNWDYSNAPFDHQHWIAPRLSWYWSMFCWSTALQVAIGVNRDLKQQFNKEKTRYIYIYIWMKRPYQRPNSRDLGLITKTQTIWITNTIGHHQKLIVL